MIGAGTAVPLPANAASSEAGGGSAQQLASRIVNDQQAMTSRRDQATRLRSTSTPGPAIDRLREELQAASAEFGMREAVRDEQAALYSLASDASLEQDVLHRLPAARAAGMADAIEAVRALWRLSGLTDTGQIRVRRTRRFMDSEPVDSLLGYYRAAASRTGLDWTYLAAINYIESDFGRLNGPSSAGALGPMQFLPSTWQQYGAGGDILSSHDSIEAAATLLRRNGAPADYRTAFLRYNRDLDYVAAVERFGAALRSDLLWLTRLYYWSTFG